MNTELRFYANFFSAKKKFIQIETAALLANQSLQDYTNFYSNKFKQLFTHFNISTTQFIRTTEPRHKQAVQHFWVKFL